jgi:hypothetical protein
MTGSSVLSRRALLLIFVAALLPRLWALTWAMPLKKGHIDEAVVVFYSLRVVAGDTNPRGFYDYPSFPLYSLAAAFKAALAGARLTGRPVPPDAEALRAYSESDELLFLLAVARLVNAVLGALLAVLIASWGSRRAGAFAGAAAALLWAFNPLAVRHAHYATVDMPAAFLFFLAVERTALYWEGEARRDGLWAAALTGLGAATKYFPAALLPFIVAVPLRRRRPGLALLLAAAAAGAFLAASPYALLEPAAFAGRFGHLFPKIVGGGGPFLWPTLKGLLVHAGPLACLAAVAGLPFFLRSTERGEKVWGWMFVFFLAFFGLWSAQLPHYALPLYPLLFLAAGRGLRELARWSRFLPAAGAVVLLAASAPATVLTLGRLSRPDTRLAALAWARETLPPASRVLRFAHTPEFTPRDPFQVVVDWENVRLADPAFSAEGFDYLIYASYNPADPVAEALAARFRLVRSFREPAPDFPHHPSVYVYAVRRSP